ncbi:OLC1v1030086C1, partial [Oldenlandia corymbosa var. corymbosa]
MVGRKKKGKGLIQPVKIDEQTSISRNLGRSVRKESSKRQEVELDLLVQKIEGSPSKKSGEGNQSTPNLTATGHPTVRLEKMSDACASECLKDGTNTRVSEVHAKRQLTWSEKSEMKDGHNVWDKFYLEKLKEPEGQLKFTNPVQRNGQKIRKIHMDDVKTEVDYWDSAVVCFALGANPPKWVMEEYIRKSWGRHGVDQAHDLKASVEKEGNSVDYKDGKENVKVLKRRAGTTVQGTEDTGYRDASFEYPKESVTQQD